MEHSLLLSHEIKNLGTKSQPQPSACFDLIPGHQVSIGAFGKIQTLPRFDENGAVKPVSIMQVS